MKRRKMNRLNSVRAEPINPSVAMNCWSKPSASIAHQLEPAPGLGTARNANTTIAVPTRKLRASGSSSRVSRHDGHGRAKYDFLRGRYLAQSDAQRNHCE